MALTEIALSDQLLPLPSEIASFLAEAENRVDRFTNKTTFTFRGFVPSDFVSLYHALRSITNSSLTSGNTFCEWGSGLGVVASLAALLGFDSIGIEIDRDLCDAAVELSEEFGIAVEFVNGSFIPRGADRLIDRAYAEHDGALSLVSDADDAYDELGLEIRDFDLVFAYPWPNDEQLTADLFDEFAARGAMLLTYNETDSVRLRRKT